MKIHLGDIMWETRSYIDLYSDMPFKRSKTLISCGKASSMCFIATSQDEPMDPAEKEDPPSVQSGEPTPMEGLPETMEVAICEPWCWNILQTLARTK